MQARRVSGALGVVAVLAASLAVGVGPAAAVTEDFTAAGTYEVTAPPGTTCATFDVDGAHGGAANTQGRPDSAGGQGGEVTISVAATAGTTFTLQVGGHGGGSGLVAADVLAFSFGVAQGTGDGAVHVTLQQRRVSSAGSTGAAARTPGGERRGRGATPLHGVRAASEVSAPRQKVRTPRARVPPCMSSTTAWKSSIG